MLDCWLLVCCYCLLVAYVLVFGIVGVLVIIWFVWCFDYDCVDYADWWFLFMVGCWVICLVWCTVVMLCV